MRVAADLAGQLAERQAPFLAIAAHPAAEGDAWADLLQTLPHVCSFRHCRPPSRVLPALFHFRSVVTLSGHITTVSMAKMAQKEQSASRREDDDAYMSPDSTCEVRTRNLVGTACVLRGRSAEQMREVCQCRRDETARRSGTGMAGATLRGRPWEHRGVAGRGVGGAPHRGRRLRQALPVSRVRPGDPARRRPRCRLAPSTTGLEDRRHWHRACWNAKDRRTTRVHRSRNAPRY